MKNDWPGPGQYDLKSMKNGDPSTLGNTGAASTDISSTLTQENVNPFLSKTARGEMWMADRDAPFTR